MNKIKYKVSHKIEKRFDPYTGEGRPDELSVWIKDESDNSIALMAHAVPFEKSTSVAHLLAASPELLEAHQEIGQLVTDIMNEPDQEERRKKLALIGNICLRAIAKAEGKS